MEPDCPLAARAKFGGCTPRLSTDTDEPWAQFVRMSPGRSLTDEPWAEYEHERWAQFDQ